MPYELDDLQALRTGGEAVERLQKLDWGFTDSPTNYLSHDIHPYAAKFIPQIPAVLVSALSLRSELVWDPFGGSGTTALEAVLRSRRAISTDANPLAEVIGRAKTATLASEDLSALNAFEHELVYLSSRPSPVGELDAELRVKVMERVPPIPNITKWFSEGATEELAIIAHFVAALPPRAADVARASMSKTVLRASNQDSETRYVAKQRSLESGQVIRTFLAELTTIRRRVQAASSHLHFRSARFVTADVREAVVGTHPGALIEPESVALIVTSPPYPNAMDYHLYHRFRLFWLGEDPGVLAKVEIGSHLRHQRERSGIETYLSEMDLCVANCFRALEPGRYAAFVIGDSVFEGRQYPTPRLLTDVASAAGFERVAVIERDVHRTRRSFIPAARRTKREAIILLRKPPRRVTVRAQRLPYRPWPYEAVLRRSEFEATVAPNTITEDADGELAAEIDPHDVARLGRLSFTHHVSVDDVRHIRTWQSVLENGTAADTARKDPKYVTHGIHPYKGKFYPQLAKALFNIAAVRVGGLIGDPFCGSGTVLLEAKLNGLNAIGFDVNPLAVAIAHAKCAILDENPLHVDRQLDQLIDTLGRVGDRPGDAFSRLRPEAAGELESWFPQSVLMQIGAALSAIAVLPSSTVREIARVLLSSLIRDVSYQDPHDLRIRRRRDDFQDAPVLDMLAAKVAELRTRLRTYWSNEAWSPSWLGRVDVLEQDIRQREQCRIGCPRLFDAVVTSPPYATALPYVDTYRLNMLCIWGMVGSERRAVEDLTIGHREIDTRTRKGMETMAVTSGHLLRSPLAEATIAKLMRENDPARVGFRRLNMAALLFRYFQDMASSLATIDDLVRSNGDVFMVLGDSVTTTAAGEMVIPTTRCLAEIANSYGWTTVEEFPITVTRDAHRNIRHSITENTILHFRKQ